MKNAALRHKTSNSHLWEIQTIYRLVRNRDFLTSFFTNGMKSIPRCSLKIDFMHFNKWFCLHLFKKTFPPKKKLSLTCTMSAFRRRHVLMGRTGSCTIFLCCFRTGRTVILMWIIFCLVFNLDFLAGQDSSFNDDCLFHSDLVGLSWVRRNANSSFPSYTVCWE